MVLVASQDQAWASRRSGGSTGLGTCGKNIAVRISSRAVVQDPHVLITHHKNPTTLRMLVIPLSHMGKLPQIVLGRRQLACQSLAVYYTSLDVYYTSPAVYYTSLVQPHFRICRGGPRTAL